MFYFPKILDKIFKNYVTQDQLFFDFE